jgi:hypothetical protein
VAALERLFRSLGRPDSDARGLNLTDAGLPSASGGGLLVLGLGQGLDGDRLLDRLSLSADVLTRGETVTLPRLGSTTGAMVHLQLCRLAGARSFGASGGVVFDGAELHLHGM